MPSVTLKSSESIRIEKGEIIASTEGRVFRVDDTNYKVHPQSGKGHFYDVKETEIGWKCNCPDHKFWGLKCKHIWTVLISLGLRQQAKANVILEPVIVLEYPRCLSLNIKKDGVRHTKHGNIQRYECADCRKKFSVNVGFEKMKHNPKAVTAAMQLYFSGESLRNTQKSLRLIGVDVSHQTVSNWISKYTEIM